MLYPATAAMLKKLAAVRIYEKRLI